MRVIPAIDIMEGQVVRLYRGDPAKKTVYGDDPVGVAGRWESEGADMLHVVDLDATLGRGSNTEVIGRILESVKIPVQVAGGLRDISLVREAAQIACRVVIGTLAFADRDALASILDELGPERVVISVDHRDGRIVTHGWQRDSGIGLIDAVTGFVGMGFSEFLLTNVGRDGTMQGPDLEFLEKACKIPDANIIASGGISQNNDISEVKKRGASGVILGRALYDGKVTIKGAKNLS